MPPSSNDSQSILDLASLRQANLQRGRRISRALGLLLIAGLLVAIGVWYLADPRDRDAIHFQAAMALGLATFFVGALLVRKASPRPRPLCPRCGCDWDLGSQMWLAWHFCPGCGLKIIDADSPEQSGGQSS